MVVVWWLVCTFPDAPPSKLAVFKSLLVFNELLIAVSVFKLSFDLLPFLSRPIRRRIETRYRYNPTDLLRNRLSKIQIRKDNEWDCPFPPTNVGIAKVYLNFIIFSTQFQLSFIFLFFIFLFIFYFHFDTLFEIVAPTN
jgi:hypothetical protein